MSVSNEWVRWERQRDGSAYWITRPIQSISELQMLVSIIDKYMAVSKTDLYMNLFFRGQATNSALIPKFFDGKIDLEKLRTALQEMLEICKDEIGDSRTDKEVYFMMRHAGLPSHLVDWSCNWRVALWFALHDNDGSLTVRPSSLWVIRHHKSDLLHSFFPADQHACERSEKQEGWAYVIRFEECADGIHALPMERDLRYEGRLLRMPIDTTAHERMMYELLRSDRWIVDIMNTPSPLSKAVVKKCYDIFQKKSGLGTTF